MEMYINCTEDGIKKYPCHSHKNWEIMFYLWGEGYLYTPETDYPFKEGMAIIVPPGVEHCSISENGFKNISIGGDFNHLLFFDRLQVVFDNDEQEGKCLVDLIFKNRYGNKDYVSYLCHSYIFFLLKNIKFENKVK